MGIEAQHESFFTEPTVALVIGITTYKHGYEKGEAPKQGGIPNLKYGAKDAKNFADFLKKKVANEAYVHTLLDEDATAANIRETFKELRRVCESSAPNQPLVFIFFSGHGMPEDGDQYLVTYDGEREKLASTALPNWEFEKLVQKLKTDRLVVFLDACHSGAYQISESKGDAGTYVVPTNLGEGQARCLIASCRADQSSWEWDEKENGIFTAHLLDLLENGTVDIPYEYIEAAQLYSTLDHRVESTAKLLKRVQNVDGNAARLSGLRLGINWPIWQKTKRTDQRKVEFIDAFEAWLNQKKEKARYSMVLRLRKYVQKENSSPGFEAFYAVFDDEFIRSENGYQEGQQNDAFDLILSAYSEQSKPSKAAAAKTGSAPQSLASPTEGDKFIVASSPSSPDLEKSSIPVSPTHALPTLQFAQTAELKRLLKPEDQAYVLEGISGNPAYFREVRILEDGLSAPISEADFSKRIQKAGKIKGEASDQYMDVIVQRFYERWPHAPEVQPQSSLNVRLGQ
ncbi:MAG TPA: caspase family protein [Candidatus Sulfotelmatobacter sp.]|jgi:hypothetical protein|nr:caspase family protein [Candidatus Sulfotelmatobacter sp.]